MLNVDFSTADLGNDPVDPGEVFPVNLEDVRRAHRVVMEHLKPTPTVNHPLLSERLGCEAHVKLENTHNIGSFKIRGGLNLLAGMSEEERSKEARPVFAPHEFRLGPRWRLPRRSLPRQPVGQPGRWCLAIGVAEYPLEVVES